MLHYLTLDRFPPPNGGRYRMLKRRGLLTPVKPWVAKLEGGHRVFQQPLNNWRDVDDDGAGMRVEYYLDLEDGDRVEVNAPRSWCDAERYTARVVNGRLRRE